MQFEITKRSLRSLSLTDVYYFDNDPQAVCPALATAGALSKLGTEFSSLETLCIDVDITLSLLETETNLSSGPLLSERTYCKAFHTNTKITSLQLGWLQDDHVCEQWVEHYIQRNKAFQDCRIFVKLDKAKKADLHEALWLACIQSLSCDICGKKEMSGVFEFLRAKFAPTAKSKRPSKVL